MFVDIHSHGDGAEDVITLRNGVGTDLLPTTFFSVGCHPWQLNPERTVGDQFVEWLGDLQHPRCMAIGETGVDAVHTPCAPIRMQFELFLMFANYAKAVRKPLILHCVRMHDQILTLRKQFFTEAPPWIYHGFTGSAELADQLRRAGIIPSLGMRYFQRNRPDIDGLQKIYRGGLFLETDNEGCPIAEVYTALSACIDVSVATIEADIYARFAETFRLKI